VIRRSVWTGAVEQLIRLLPEAISRLNGKRNRRLQGLCDGLELRSRVFMATAAPKACSVGPRTPRTSTAAVPGRSTHRSTGAAPARVLASISAVRTPLKCPALCPSRTRDIARRYALGSRQRASFGNPNSLCQTRSSSLVTTLGVGHADHANTATSRASRHRSLSWRASRNPVSDRTVNEKFTQCPL
jgi:hypothetical protein